MKTLIFQVAVGEVKPFYEVCIQSVKEYANRIGADHKVLREPVLKIKPVNSHRSKNALRLDFLPIFEKEVAFNYLKDYDKIAIVDADIFIRDTAPNIFDEIDNSVVFAGVLEREMPLTQQYTDKIKRYTQGQYSPLKDVDWKWNAAGAEFYNMGLMLFTKELEFFLNGQTPEQFIRRKEFERFVNGEGNWKWSTDQTLLNYWVKKSGMRTKNLDWKWNALFKGIKDDKLPEAHFIHFFLAAVLPEKGKEIPRIIKDLDAAKHIKGHG